MVKKYIFPLLLLAAGLSEASAQDTAPSLQAIAWRKYAAQGGPLTALRRAEAYLQAGTAADSTAPLYLLLGDLYLDMGKTDSARIAFNAVLKAVQAPLLQADAREGLARCALQAGAAQQALPLQLQVLRTRERLLGRDSLPTGSAALGLGEVYLALGDTTRAAPFFDYAWRVYQAGLPTQDPALAPAYRAKGKWLAAQNRPAEALAFYDTAYALLKAGPDGKTPKMAQLLRDRAEVYAAKKQYASAFEQYSRAARVLEGFYGTIQPCIAPLSHRKGDMLQAQYDLRGATENYREALHHYGPSPSPERAALQYKIGYCMESLGMEDIATRLYDSVRTLLAVLPEPLLFAKTAERSGSILARQGNYARALPFFRQATQAYSALPTREARHGLLRARNGELLCYLNLRQWANARTALSFSEEILQSPFPFGAMDKAEVLKLKALLEAGVGHPEPALAWVRKSLGLLWPDRDISRVNRVQAAPVLELLALEAQLIAETSHSPTDALGLVGTGLQLARRLHLPFAEDGHLPWEDAVQKLYTTAVETYFQAWRKTKEKSFLEKALLLAEEHKDQDGFRSALATRALQFRDVPDKLLKEKIRLEQALLGLEKQSWDAGQEGDAGRARSFEKRLFTMRGNLSALNARLEREAPHFARFLGYEKRLSVNALRNALATDQTLISYYMKGDDWFIFALSRESLQGMRLKNDIPLEIVVSNYLQRMSTAPMRTGPEREKQALLWTGTSQQLFNWVLAPVLQRTAPTPRIVIIPDGPLRGVPFEALLMDTPAFATQFKSHAYLGRRYGLSYAFSANLFCALSQQSPRSRFAGKYLLTVAPGFSPDQHPDELPSSLEESKAIRKLFGGRQLKGTEATLGNFLGLAPDYRVLHLSTPARSTPFDTSFIAFSEPDSGVQSGVLYAADIYGIALSADLFVLSRQETVPKTFGQTKAPDPLASGLWYAGAKSLAASSWKVDDPRFSWVVQQFFLYIRGGLPKDLALQRAKQDYLNQNANLDAHPYYWAGMILSGNMAPLPDPRLQWVVSWLIGLVGLGIALTLYWKWIQKRNPRRSSGVFMDEEWPG